MRRIIRLAVLGLMCLCLFLGCNKPAANDADSAMPYGSTIRGGQPADGATLSDIEISEDGTAINIHFTNGSEQLTTVPEYSIKSLSAPYRLSIDINANHNGYDTGGITAGERISGLFIRDALNEEGRMTLFVQLKAQDSYTVSEIDGVLSISLFEAEAEEGEKHYACINAYEEYRYAAMPPGTTELTPTLCNGGGIIMISKPFEELSEAEAYAEKAQNVFTQENEGRQITAKAVTLKPGQLPDYMPCPHEEEISQLQPVLKDGQGQSLPVVMTGGRLLCVSGDGKRLFAEAGFRESESDKPINEQLVILHPDNTKERLNALTDIHSIEEAQFSPDGNGLCIMDGSGSGEETYYYNLGSKEVVSISDYNYDSVYDFTFAGDSTIYTLGGSIVRVDISGSSCEISTVMDDASNIGAIDSADGVIYYSEIYPDSDESCGVYRMEDGSPKRVCDGSRISISPDGKFMLVMLDNASESGYSSKVSILDIAAGSREITGVTALSGYSWAPDSSCLYYSVPTPEGEYPNMLVRYDVSSGESAELMGILTGEFYCVDTNTINIVMIHRDRNYTVTFKLDTN